MRPVPLTWTLALVAALIVVSAVALAVGGSQDAAPAPAGPDGQAMAETLVTQAAPPDPTARATTSTTTVAPSTTITTVVTATTTTAPPETTTTAAPTTTSSSGYTAVLKPRAAPNTVAPGGALTKHLAADIAVAFDLEPTDVEAAIGDVDLPPEAGSNPEGWLAPGFYELGDNATASQVVQAMVNRRIGQLEERQLPREQWQRVVTAASVIEKETYNQNEKPSVARVLVNRLAGGGPLQMDSIILYPVPEDRIFTTREERASSQPYNSYKHNGLPPTPICSPDEASIDAFLGPPPGDWWFYVTIDLHSGETRFAVTYEEHQANVELLRAWLEDNPTP